MARCSQDSEWGPSSTCRALDFTVYFEQTASLTVDIAFLLFAASRIVHLFTQAKQPRKRIGCLKGVGGFVLMLSVAGNLWYSKDSSSKGNVVPVLMAAPVLQLLSSIALSVAWGLEYLKAAPASALVLAFLLIKTVFAGVILRTYLLSGLLDVAKDLVVSTIALAVAYAFLLSVELYERRVSVTKIPSRLPYMWILPLLWKGRNSVLTNEDCTPLPQPMTAQTTHSKLHAALLTTNKVSPRYLFIASLKAFGTSLFGPVLPRLALLVATFAQPFLVMRILTYVSDPEQPSSQGWRIVSGFALAFSVMAVATSAYWEKVFDFIVEYRGALVGVIYSKSLVLSAPSGRSLSGGVASTYISVDVERICTGAEHLHEFWSAGVSVMIAIVILYQQASWPAFFPLAIIIGLIVVSGHLSKSVKQSQSAWLAATDKRVKYMSSVIHSFLPIKWSRYESVLADRAAYLRADEVRGAATFYKYVTYSVALSNTASIACILAVLGPYASWLTLDGVLDAAKMFTIVTTLNLLSTPLIYLGQTMPHFAAAYASMLRIQGYLTLSEASTGLLELDRDHETDAVNSICMDSLSFAWSPEDTEPFLKEISLKLDEQKLHLCVGPVASGKSMLLLSMLSETTCVTGDYSPLAFRIAYASQDAFIISGTIRDNIVFGRPFIQEWYDRVLEACALNVDIRNIPSGDGTLLNEKGDQLSGGQRQRVALARAVYADAPWTFLDDPLSALDAHTEAHVFRSLFGTEGLLRHRAVLLISHNLEYIHHAEKIIVLDAGRVQYQGSVTDIQAQGYKLSALKINQIKHADTSQEKEPGTEHVKEEETAEAPIAQSSRGLAPYLFFARQISWFDIVLVLMLAIPTGLAMPASQWYLRAWATSGGSHLRRWIEGYATLSLTTLLLIGFAFYKFAVTVSSHAGKGVHAAEVQGFLGTSPSYVMRTPTGRIVNRFSQDVFKCDFEFPISLWNSMITLTLVVACTVFVMIPVPWLAFSAIPLGLLYYINLVLYLATSKQLQHLEASSKSPIYTLFSTTISGLTTIRALRAQKYFLNQSETRLNESQAPFYFRFGGIRLMRTLLAFIASIIAVSLASLAVNLRQTVNASSLGLALSVMTVLSTYLTGLILSLSKLENASVAISRVHEIASLPAEEDSAAAAAPFSVDGVADKWLTRGEITYNNVQLRYRSDLDPVVKDVSFKIAPGQKVAVCGRSGSGKSSLVMALFRAFDSAHMSGSITIDGVNIQDLSLDALRSSLGLVAQDPFIWNAPLRHNLDPHGLYEDKDIWEILRRVDLNDAVASLPEQLDTVLDDSASLSKGQRQLLCLARVLLRKSKIVTLDEASSSLDFETDEKIREVIRSDLADSTVIAVAHRISTVIDFDVVLVMEDGVLMENGPPRDLLEKPHSMFGKLAASQGIKV